MYAIEVIDLKKEFSQTKPLQELIFHPLKRAPTIKVFENLNLKINSSELFCLVGPNGVGKTTLIKILCGLILPTKGEVLIQGYSLLKEEAKVKDIIALVSGEERSFYWRLTARQNLEFFGTLYGLSPAILREKIKELSKFLEIEEFLDTMFQKLSTGMKQRLGIIRALLKEAKIIFMDEPTKSLDPYAAKSLREFIKEKLVKKEKKTIFFTTHNLSEAESLADRIAIMDKGRIIYCGSVNELKRKINMPEANLEEVFTQVIKNT
jgi:ABC-2 type transport system ATP-binding protein